MLYMYRNEINNDVLSLILEQVAVDIFKPDKSWQRPPLGHLVSSTDIPSHNDNKVDTNDWSPWKYRLKTCDKQTNLHNDLTGGEYNNKLFSFFSCTCMFQYMTVHIVVSYTGTRILFFAKMLSLYYQHGFKTFLLIFLVQTNLMKKITFQVYVTRMPASYCVSKQ